MGHLKPAPFPPHHADFQQTMADIFKENEDTIGKQIAALHVAVAKTLPDNGRT